MGLRPRVGFSPNSPVQDAGTRIEPAPSDAFAIGTTPAATRLDAPPDEPPGRALRIPGVARRAVERGFRGCGEAEFRRGRPPENAEAGGLVAADHLAVLSGDGSGKCAAAIALFLTFIVLVQVFQEKRDAVEGARRQAVKDARPLRDRTRGRRVRSAGD